MSAGRTASGGGPLRVLALTRTDPHGPVAKRTSCHASWVLRVEMMLPHLEREHNIHVETRRLPQGRAKRAFLGDLGPFDFVWLHRYTTWPWELARLKDRGRRVVLDIDDPVCYSSSSLGNFSLSRQLKFWATARGSSAVFAASDGLVRLAARHNSRTSFIPLCADPHSHCLTVRPRSPGEPLRLLWLGSRSTFKYLEFVRPHLEEIGRLGRRIELVVVGHSRLELEHLPVSNVAWSREAEIEQFARCHVGLVPLTDDRWTRAKATLKPLQYMANGLPFIGPPVGVNVRVSDQGANGILAASPEGWARAVVTLESDEELRMAMGRSGIDYVLAYHSPEVLAAQVARQFRAVIAEDSRTLARSA